MAAASPDAEPANQHRRPAWQLPLPVTRAMLASAMAQALRPPSTAAEPAAEAPAADGPLHRTHLLLAEDNPINRELATELLRAAGADITVVGDGRETLQALERASFDAVLMDCQMPEMDGYEAARRIRADPRWHSLPVIAMTANAMAGDRERAIAAGMDDHIVKPLDVDAMFATLARWLGKRTGQRERDAATPGA